MDVPIDIKAKVEIANGVEILINKSVCVGMEELASALRRYVAYHHKGDDAGVDYFYNSQTGLIHLGDEEDWVLETSRENHNLYKILEVADMLCGSDFSTTITPSNK